MKTPKSFRWLTGLTVSVLVVGCSDGQPGTTDPLQPAFDVAAGGLTSTDIPAGGPGVALFVEGEAQSHAPVIRRYRNSNAWFGENRDDATLLFIGKILADDYFIHPLSALASAIPAGTAVAFMSSNGFGSGLAASQQNAGVANLASFLAGGGTVIVDMGDNLFTGGYRAPGSVGTPNLVFPLPFSSCADATLAPAALGPDSILGTADDHPMVKGPDGVAGTADDLNNSNIDMAFSCWVAHGNLVDGITLPGDATVLVTAGFGGIQKPIVAEYCHDGGRVILDTTTKEFTAHKGPLGTGANRPTFFMINLFTYALSPASRCIIPVDIDIKPGSDPNSINCNNESNTIAVAILTTDDFDATTVDHTTVTFEGASETHVNKKTGVARRHEEDVDDDGDTDLVLHFRLGDTNLDCGSTDGTLTGETFGGQAIEGTDAVRMIDEGGGQE